MRFQNVSFFVVPDREPFTSLPVDRRGILGVPIHFGIGTWHWSKSGTIRLGEKIPPQQSPPNLVFFRKKIVLLAEIAGRSAFFTFDSGASRTDLNTNFLETFRDLVTNAQKTTREGAGLGGTSTFEAYILPELRLSVAGHPLTLRPAEVTVQKIAGIGGGRWELRQRPAHPVRRVFARFRQHVPPVSIESEPVVAKQASAHYAPEATTWVKIKNRQYSQAIGCEDFFNRRRAYQCICGRSKCGQGLRRECEVVFGDSGRQPE
jgi:hypothetical protein